MYVLLHITYIKYYSTITCIHTFQSTVHWLISSESSTSHISITPITLPGTVEQQYVIIILYINHTQGCRKENLTYVYSHGEIVEAIQIDAGPQNL